jgi:hypothetical protein
MLSVLAPLSNLSRVPCWTAQEKEKAQRKHRRHNREREEDVPDQL